MLHSSGCVCSFCMLRKLTLAGLLLSLVSVATPSGASTSKPPKDKTGCIVTTEIIDLPDGRTVIKTSWLCERKISK